MKTKGLHQDVWIGVVILILCGVIFGINSGLNSSTGMMPRLLGGIMALLGALIILEGIRKTKAAEGAMEKMISCSSLKVPLSAYLYIVGYIILFRAAGYFIATPVFLLSLMKHFGVKSRKLPALVTVVYLAVIYLVFVKKLNVSVDNFGLIGNYISMH